MSAVARKYLPLFVLAVCGIAVIIEFFIEVPQTYTDFTSTILTFSMIIASFSLGMGSINIVRYHLNNIRTRKPAKTWWLSIWLLFLMFLFLISGLSTPEGTSHSFYRFIYDTIYVQNSLAIGTFIGFFVPIALFYHLIIRGRRDWEALVLMIFCFLTFLGRVPFGEALWPGFTQIAGWIEEVPGMAEHACG
jgi:hypothetical protein